LLASTNGVYLIDGAATLLLEQGTAIREIDIVGGNAVVVPKRTWRTLKTNAHCRMLFVTMGAGTNGRQGPLADGTASTDSTQLSRRRRSKPANQWRHSGHPRPFTCRVRIDRIPTGRYAASMNPTTTQHAPKAGARKKLLDAALSLIREKGYSSTSVDELCAQARVTKGAFFHHFKSKDALGVAAANHWSELTGAFFETAPYHQYSDPLDRVLGYLDFRKAILTGELAEFTCLVGTMVQETYATNPDIRAACEASISGHAAEVATDIAEAMKRYRIRAPWTAESLALHTQAVLQGAFILAKAKGSADVAAACIEHLRRYIELLFQPARRRTKEAS
jgi:TetR/AcrR family transcriptional regulator, transcriptional repressor for nem operon